MRPVPFGIACLAATALAACTAPALVDVDGRPLQSPVLVASIANGWVAVDSGPAGTRAVLALHAEVPRTDHQPLEIAGLQLRFGADSIPPSRLHCEVPASCRSVKKPVEDPDEAGVEEPADHREEAVDEMCVHIVRAEFLLPRVPTPRDPVVLIIGDSSTRLEWRGP
jgi:hypothetical protein